MPEASEAQGRESGVEVKVDNAVAWISLGRGAGGGAITNEVLDAIRAAVGELGARKDVRVLVIRGAGERAFGSGMDLNDLRAMDPATVQRHFDTLNACLVAIEQSPIPSIAMVRGYAIGGGCELAAACDLRVIASTARVAIPIARLGHCPDRENLRRLVRLISPTHLKAMIMTDATLTADEAQRAGLFNWAVPDFALDAFTQALADTVCSKAPLSLRASKKALAEVLDGSVAHAEDPELDLVTSLWRSRDFQEGVGAFLERRKPAFEGR